MIFDLILAGVVKFCASFLGTLGFAIVLHAPKKAWLPASAIGGLSFVIYWALLQAGASEAVGNFIGALIGAFLAHYCARRMRMIATVFLMLSIIPLVPGLGLYRCMHYLAQEMYAEGAAAGVMAMVSIVMIALGLGISSYAFRVIVLRRPRKGGAAG